jgi:hypothetical protein
MHPKDHPNLSRTLAVFPDPKTNIHLVPEIQVLLRYSFSFLPALT